MIQLPHGCNCSGTPGDPDKHTKDSLPVYPKNWDAANVSLKKDWYISYYFRDPAHKGKYAAKGKFVIVKGMNYYKTRTERQEAVRVLMAEQLKMLKDEGYNPITDSFNTPVPEINFESDIPPYTPFLEALEIARRNYKASETQMANVKSVLKYFSEAARFLKLENIPIQSVKRKHIRFTLEQCARAKSAWTDKTYNWYRRDLGCLFNEVTKVDAIEHNPVEKLEIKATVVAPRLELTTEERKTLDKELRASNFRLWRFMHIFYHSGARFTELSKLQRCHVDLKNQEFKVFVKKKKAWTWVTKPIKDIVLPLWKQVIEEAESIPGGNDQDFLFSEELLPYYKPIRPEQYSRRWKRWVKDKLGIEADFYSLKHSNSDEIADAINIETAAALNNHSVEIAKKHYALREKQREERRYRETIKKATNVFV